MAVAETIVAASLAYVVCGLLVGLPFITFGIGHIDHAAQGTSLAFRMLVLPGTVALWPLIAAKWWRCRTKGVDK